MTAAIVGQAHRLPLVKIVRRASLTLFPLPGKQEKDQGKCGQNRCRRKRGCGNLSARMKIGFPPRRHAEKEKQKAGVDRDYAERFSGFG